MSVGTAVGTAPLLKTQVLSLSDAGVSEQQLETMITADPSVLGLGDDLVVVERQRRQLGAGILDLLLEDREEELRYEVELMLGRLDESHLIRAIEYWDIERRRYPGYDHKAVIIAEDITSRFLNVIQLFSGSIPIIAIQVNCFKAEDKTALTFIRVLDSTDLRIDDTQEVADSAVDRGYWNTKVGSTALSLMDDCASIANEYSKTKYVLNYKKGRVGLGAPGTSNNSIYFRPRKSFLGLRARRLQSREAWMKRFEEAGLDASISKGHLKIDLTPDVFSAHKGLMREFLESVIKEEDA